MAHTSGVFENRVQRLVIWDVSKYLCGSLFEVILRGKRDCSRLRASTLFPGWLIFSWKRWREMDNPPETGQHQDATVPPNPCTQANDTLCPPKLLATCFQCITYPKYWTWFVLDGLHKLEWKVRILDNEQGFTSSLHHLVLLPLHPTMTLSPYHGTKQNKTEFIKIKQYSMHSMLQKIHFFLSKKFSAGSLRPS